MVLLSCPSVCFRELLCKTLMGLYCSYRSCVVSCDIVVVNKEEVSVQITDVAVPADCNITSKEAEKVEKYGTFQLNLSLWKGKSKIIPIVVGWLGCVTHALKSNIKKLSVFDLYNVELLE